MALAAIGVGISAIGLISSFVGSQKASAAAKKAAKIEAHAEDIVTAERLRQIGVEERVTRGQTIAAVAGSNVVTNIGSPLQILAEQAREFAYEKNVVREAGATKAAAALQRGSDTATAYKYQSYSNLASGVSNIFSILSQSGSGSSGTKGP